jgi:GR25 family glycosyltransferase involved in LPS biosynthesis
MKFFVIHYTPLVERRVHIVKELDKAGIKDYTFILSKDREGLTQEDVSKFANISPPEMSVFCKHVEVFKASALDDDMVVVFEDDSVLCDDFLKNLDKCLSQLKTEQWDVLFASESGGAHCQVEKDKLVKRTTKSRGAGLYVLNVGVGKRIYEIFTRQMKILLPVDHWFNQINPIFKLNYFWSEPTLVKQGSELNVFESSLDAFRFNANVNTKVDASVNPKVKTKGNAKMKMHMT